MKFFVFLGLWALANFAVAEDEGQYLGDTIDFETPLEESLKNEDVPADEYYSGEGSLNDQKMEKKLRPAKKSSFAAGDVDDMDTSVSAIEELKGKGVMQDGGHEKDQEYHETNLRQEMKKISAVGDRNFALTAYADNYEYYDEANSFKRTYREEDSSVPMVVRFSGHRFVFHQKFLDLGVGLGAGIGYNSGLGRYSGTTIIAPARLFLWTLPLDLSFVAEVPMTRFVKLSLAGGPSALGIWQHRTDLDEGNERKNIRQVSVGVFYEGKVNFSLSDLDPRHGVNMFNEYSITKMYFSLAARGHHYEAFKDSDVMIKGVSFGAGFTFEYI